MNSNSADFAPHSDPPTNVRHQVILVTTLMSLLLYLDRYCVSFVEKLIGKDLNFSTSQSAMFLSAFFWTYALAQVPAGWLNDRFGARRTMFGCVVIWSLFTGLTGLASSFVVLVLLRLGFGFAQAGAYPTASSLIGRWAPVAKRGAASSWVAWGGRVGAAVAPLLTALLLARLGGDNWRTVLMLYAALGAALGAVIWYVYRDSPLEHPRCNDAERRLILAGRPQIVASGRNAVPWRSLLTSGSMCLNCLSQATTNFGWTFLVTLLARYLEEVHRVPLRERGWMCMTPLLVACGGMLLGGRLADALTARLGLRWGRALPMSISKFGCAFAYLGCFIPWSTVVSEEYVPWVFTAIFSLVAFCTDLGIPALWAYTQDVGGRNVGAVLGWGNMWGNFGAGLAASSLGLIVGESGNWNLAFAACSLSFLISGVAALGIDATQPVEETVKSTATT